MLTGNIGKFADDAKIVFARANTGPVEELSASDIELGMTVYTCLEEFSRVHGSAAKP